MKTINTRDLYKRQQELEDLKNALESANDALKEVQEAVFACDSDNPDHDEWYEKRDAAQEAVDAAALDFGDDEKQELEELDSLESDISEWRHGETMVPVDDFEDYARELAEDLGTVDRDAPWPLRHIDWKAAAEELEQDYTSVSYQGDDYFVRSC